MEQNNGNTYCQNGVFKKVFDADVFDKSKAMEYYRSELKRFKKVVKQYDFEYLPEKR